MHILMMIHRLADASPYCFFVHEQARALAALGHTVDVISPVPIPPLMHRTRPLWAQVVDRTPQEQTLDGVHITYPRCPALGDAGERILGGRSYLVGALPAARRIHRANPVDLVHAHMIDRDGHAGMLTARALKVPFAVTAHGTDVLRYFKPGMTPLRRNADIVRSADALMAVSNMLMDRLRPYRPADKITEIVPNGLDLSLIPEVSREPGRILSVGTLCRRKCMDTTIEAFAGLADSFKEATLRIIGIGDEEAALRAQAERLGVGNRVLFLGGMDHAAVMEEMARADVFVLPSWGEGFGIVYIEAMAAGCVTIGSIDEGIADTIRDGENGFLVQAGDAAATEKAIRAALAAPDDMANLRKAAVLTAQAMTWERNAQTTEQIYARMLGRARGNC